MGYSGRRLLSLVGCDARVVRRVVPDVHEYASAIRHRWCSSPHDIPSRHYVTPLTPTSFRTPAVQHATRQMLLNAVVIQE